MPLQYGLVGPILTAFVLNPHEEGVTTLPVQNRSAIAAPGTPPGSIRIGSKPKKLTLKSLK
jgi:hypothetical protein